MEGIRRMSLFDGLKVLDLSTLFAGPVSATLLGDYGAEVIKIEHPKGDDLRNWGVKKEGISFWWKVYSRNKRLLSLNLKLEDGREALKRLITKADVLIENFRPGRMKSWGFSYEEVSKINSKIIMAHVTGFGQNGPYSSLPGFGTLAEAMSGFANLNGYPDSPPTLPPMALADGIAGLTTAFAVSAALWKREKTMIGEEIDISLYEPLMWILGPEISEKQQLNYEHTRHGNQSSITSPRNLYKTRDERWIALSASSQNVTERLFKAIGRPDLIEDPDFRTNSDRLRNRAKLDSIIESWTSGLNQMDIVKLLRNSDVAVAPIYDSAQIMEDMHYRQRGSVLDLNDETYGKLSMQGLIAQFGKNPGELRWSGRDNVGADSVQILKELGYSLEEIVSLKANGVTTYPNDC